MIAGRPCVLIADDDPISRQYLCAVLEQCGCDAIAADGCATALHTLSATPRSIDLLLLDRRMPGGGGIELLHALRTAGVAAPAIATSAEIDSAVTSSLCAAGFSTTLQKPASLAEVHALVARFIRGVKLAAPVEHGDRTEMPALLDDSAALATLGGDHTALVALRRLFAAELEGLDKRGAGTGAAPHAAQAAERLHRLRASCGICGALRLRDATERLQGALRTNSADIDDAGREFASACDATLAALAVAPDA